MKNIPFILLFFTILLYGQPNQDAKRDYIWMLGYDNNSDTPEIDGVEFNFNKNPLEISHFYKPIEIFATNASICDENGNLLFYSNGCSIVNGQHDIIVDTINYGNLWNLQCTAGGLSGYVIEQGMLILPIENTFYFVYMRFEQVAEGPRPDRLAVTQLDEKEDESWEMVYKDKSLIQDLLLVAQHLSACRHANGRDWWVITPIRFSSSYYKFLIKPDTILGPFEQKIGIPLGDRDSSSGGCLFTSDGTKYLDYAITADVQIFDFDRCTGEFSHPIHIPIQDIADTTFNAGIAASPNSRYLYVSSSLYIYQFDLWADDIEASKITVATYDGFEAPSGFRTTFYQAQLAPDGKIYVTGPGGKQAIHVIEYPDRAGLACEVVQHKHILPAYIGGGLPHFPNFRLGAVEGSVCDSLVVGIEGVEEEALFIQVFPNPAHQFFTIRSKEVAKVHITSIVGKQVYSERLNKGDTQINTQKWMNGLYIVRIESVDGTVSTQKIVVNH